MKKLIRGAVLILFLVQIGYLSYRVPQVLLTEDSFPPEVKLSAIITGFCLGALYFLKDYSSPFK